MDVCLLSQSGKVWTRIRSITDRHSLFPSSCSRTPMGLPLQEAFPRMGGIRGFHVPLKYPSRLGAASTPEVQHLRQRTIKPLSLTSYRFGSSLSAPLACWLWRCCSGSLMFTIRLNPCSFPPCGAGRVEAFSQSPLPGYPEGYFSRKLHTRRLLTTHVPVGYRQQNTGFYIAVKQSKQLFKRLHVALIDSPRF